MKQNETYTAKIDEALRLKAARLARLRNAKNKRGIASKRFSDHTDERAHYIGLLGEIVTADYLGLEVDELERLGGDGGTDLVLGGLTIDVKTRTRVGYDLLFYEDLADARAEIYVLAWANLRMGLVTLAGWLWDSEVRLLAVPMEYRQGQKRVGVKANQLRPMQTIKESVGLHNYASEFIKNEVR